jgi:hypothetical protein
VSRAGAAGTTQAFPLTAALEAAVAIYQQKPSFAKAYSFALVTGALFLFAWIGQAVFQWIEAGNEAAAHGETATAAQFLPRFLAATLENWQSEFLQLVWQAAGLALFYYWGSSQSRDGDERLEAKVDELLRQAGVDPASVTKDPVEIVSTP